MPTVLGSVLREAWIQQIVTDSQMLGKVYWLGNFGQATNDGPDSDVCIMPLLHFPEIEPVAISAGFLNGAQMAQPCLAPKLPRTLEPALALKAR